jgi:shikimate kinase
MNVTLIGMAGAGKSYLGAKLAEELGLEWIDSDVVLSDAFGGRDIQSILNELGEERYVEVEGNLCVDHMRGRDNLLLSPAGSIVYNDEWLKHVRDSSTVIYLKVPYETIEARLSKVPPRAIIGLGRKTLRELYDERHPRYEDCADLIIDTHGRDTDRIAQMILDFLRLDKKRETANV